MSETPPAAPAPQADGSLKEDEKNWGMLAHILVFIGVVGVPFGNLVGPLIAYFVKKDESKYVRFHAIQSFAFQLGMTAIGIVLAVPFAILFFITGGLIIFIAAPIFVLLSLAVLVYVVLTGIKASKGEDARYYYVGDWAYKKVYEEDWKPM